MTELTTHLGHHEAAVICQLPETWGDQAGPHKIAPFRHCSPNGHRGPGTENQPSSYPWHLDMTTPRLSIMQWSSH